MRVRFRLYLTFASYEVEAEQIRLPPLPKTAKFQKGHAPKIDPAQTPIRCGAKTRSGARCAKFPVEEKRRRRLQGGLSTGPKTAEGRAAISAANTKHGRYKNWREKQAKERYYRGEIQRVMQEAREAGSIRLLGEDCDLAAVSSVLCNSLER